MVNLELYRIFVVVAREKSITRASLKLNISQPAITKHIKNLENQLNEVLFIRTSGMTLTKKGKELYDKINKAIDTINEVENMFIKSNVINFGIYRSLLILVMSDVIGEFYEQNKNSKINLCTEPFNSLVDKFNNYELDILCISKDESLENVPDVKYIKCDEVNYIFVANKKSKLLNKKLSINELNGKTIYVAHGTTPSKVSFLNLIENNNIDCKINQIDSTSMINIIQNHDAIGFINSDYAKKELKNGTIEQLDIDIDIDIDKTEYGIYVHKNNITKELNSLINLLKNYRDYNN